MRFQKGAGGVTEFFRDDSKKAIGIIIEGGLRLWYGDEDISIEDLKEVIQHYEKNIKKCKTSKQRTKKTK